MKTLLISLDFLAGPLWKDEFIDGEPGTGIPAVDNDEAPQALNDQICELHSSYYEFDSLTCPAGSTRRRKRPTSPACSSCWAGSTPASQS